MVNVKRKNMMQLADYRKEAYISHPLKYLFFELTNACNLRCLHCGSNSGCDNKYLPYEYIEKVLEEVSQKYDPKGIMICLTGGEPMLHKDIYHIISKTRELGFSCGMTSNATLIDKTASERLKRSGLQSISVSLDGLESQHDFLRNQKGSFCDAINGIENLVYEKSIITQITTVVNKNNIDSLEEIFSLAVDLKVDSWRPINIEPIGRAKDRKDLLLDADEFKILLDFIKEKRFNSQTPIDVTFGCSHYLTEEYERMVRNNYFICLAGIAVASILCNGDIYACLDIERRHELVQGNIQNDSFIDIWENNFKFYRQDRSLLNIVCSNCSDREFCCGDSVHTWNYSLNEPILCLKKIL